jgi:guanine nucleotide-binding protein G(i) subunit alpha
MKDEYMPTDEDVLRCRLRSSGIVEKSFEVQGATFNFVDVGGQRNERKKWLHCFAGVNMLMYITAMNEYDQMLYEDDTVNRMEESIAVFKGLLDYEEFRSKPVIIFFNKRDLLHERLKKGVDPSVLWPDEYKGNISLSLSNFSCKLKSLKFRRLRSESRHGIHQVQIYFSNH